MLIPENTAWLTCVADPVADLVFFPATPWPISAVVPWLTLVCMQVSHASMVPPWTKCRRDAAGNSLALFDSLFCKSGIYLRGPHSRATARASSRHGGLPGPRHGWRPCATWRGRGGAPRRIGMDFVAAPGTAGLANARRGKARDGVSRASVKPGINPNRRHDDED